MSQEYSSDPKIKEFNKENLYKAVEEANKRYPPEKISNDVTLKYLYQFLKYDNFGSKHVAETMVIENNHTSMSYIRDHKDYLSTSFNERPRFTTRIHFFADKNAVTDFEENGILDRNKVRHKEIWSSYLGFVTVKPQGGVILGSSYLKPYDRERNRLRYYNSILNNVEFEVFGKRIDFLKSISFQSQDMAVGACATFSIWVAFHKLSYLFKIKRMTPFEITKSAGRSLQSSGRLFPGGSLGTNQIISAFESAGLAVQAFENHRIDSDILKNVIYAYNKMGIPLLLGYRIIEVDKHGVKSLDGHMVPIVGYRLKEQITEKSGNGISLISDDLLRFYAHNDQLGPFAKIDFLKVAEEDFDEVKIKYVLEHILETRSNQAVERKRHHGVSGIKKRYVDADNNDDKMSPLVEDKVKILNDDLNIGKYYLKTFQLGNTYKVAKATSLLVPLDPDIKVNFFSVKRSVTSFDYAIKAINPSTNNFKWNIYLSLSNEYKYSLKEFEQSDFEGFSSVERQKILTTKFPKYIWVATLFDINPDTRLLDLIYDATAFPNEFCLYQANFFEYDFGIRFCSAVLELEDGVKEKELETKTDLIFTSFHLDFIRKNLKRLQQFNVAYP